MHSLQVQQQQTGLYEQACTTKTYFPAQPTTAVRASFAFLWRGE